MNRMIKSITLVLLLSQIVFPMAYTNGTEYWSDISSINYELHLLHTADTDYYTKATQYDSKGEIVTIRFDELKDGKMIFSIHSGTTNYLTIANESTSSQTEFNVEQKYNYDLMDKFPICIPFYDNSNFVVNKEISDFTFIGTFTDDSGVFTTRENYQVLGKTSVSLILDDDPTDVDVWEIGIDTLVEYTYTGHYAIFDGDYKEQVVINRKLSEKSGTELNHKYERIRHLKPVNSSEYKWISTFSFEFSAKFVNGVDVKDKSDGASVPGFNFTFIMASLVIFSQINRRKKWIKR